MLLFKAHRLEDFKKFIQERREIYHRKEVLKIDAPYTEDEILQTEKFCNIDREHDHQTRYYRHSIEGKDLEFQIMSSFIFRFGKSASSVCETFFKYDNWEDVYNTVMDLDFKFHMHDKRITTSPYCSPVVPHSKKSDYEKTLGNLRYMIKLVNDVYEEIYDYLISSGKTPLEMTYDIAEIMPCSLRPLFHLHQILADISVTAPQYVDPEGITYMAVGAEKSLKAIMNNEPQLPKVDRTKGIWLYEDVLKEIMDYTGDTYFTIEHSLCEYNKYSEYLLGKRTRKNIFISTRDRDRFMH